jgi:hypothetical protein
MATRIAMLNRFDFFCDLYTELFVILGPSLGAGVIH